MQKIVNVMFKYLMCIDGAKMRGRIIVLIDVTYIEFLHSLYSKKFIIKINTQFLIKLLLYSDIIISPCYTNKK